MQDGESPDDGIFGRVTLICHNCLPGNMGIMNRAISKIYNREEFGMIAKEVMKTGAARRRFQ